MDSFQKTINYHQYHWMTIVRRSCAIKSRDSSSQSCWVEGVARGNPVSVVGIYFVCKQIGHRFTNSVTSFHIPFQKKLALSRLRVLATPLCPPRGVAWNSSSTVLFRGEWVDNVNFPLWNSNPSTTCNSGCSVGLVIHCWCKNCSSGSASFSCRSWGMKANCGIVRRNSYSCSLEGWVESTALLIGHQLALSLPGL